MSWVFTKDWPLNIGGKPHFALPAWIPITFELTVLFSAVGMVLTFCYPASCRLFVKKHHFHASCNGRSVCYGDRVYDKTNDSEVQQFLQSSGAKEVNCQVAETGWWIGRYDREQKLYREEKGY